MTLLALVGGTLARIANEVIQLQRSEVMELEEPFTHGKVGSSTMPHKRNPAHCERVVAIGRMLLQELRHLDKVAYIRFASVYLEFEDVGEFMTVINELFEKKT